MGCFNLQTLQGSSKQAYTSDTAEFKLPHSKHVHLPFPKCVFMLMYLAVPVRLLCSLYGICFFVSGSIYSFAKPKSMIWMTCWVLFPGRPIKKFSGFTSLYIKFFEWTYSMREILVEKEKRIFILDFHYQTKSWLKPRQNFHHKNNIIKKTIRNCSNHLKLKRCQVFTSSKSTYPFQTWNVCLCCNGHR